jgi:hypothetical protein
MEIPHDQAAENCASKGAIDPQVFPGCVMIRDRSSNPKNDWAVKYQDKGNQDEQSPPNQSEPSPTPFRERLTVVVHGSGTLFPRG